VIKAFLIFAFALALGGCPSRGAAPAQPQQTVAVNLVTQAKIASAIAVTINETMPLLRDAESQEGDDIIHTSSDETAARLRLGALEARWKPVWDAMAAVRVAHGAWATVLEKGGNREAAAKEVLTAFCKLAPLLPRSVPRLSLATLLCEVTDGSR